MAKQTESPPFATPGGKPINPPTNAAPPANLWKSPSGGGDPTPPAPPTEAHSPKQSADVGDKPNTTYAPHLISRPQSPVRPQASGANQGTIPAGGPATKADPGKWSKTEAVTGNAKGSHVPFKNMRGGK